MSGSRVMLRMRLIPHEVSVRGDWCGVDGVAIKIDRKWLWSVVALPVAFAGVAVAEPWLEKSPRVGQTWDDLPFLGPPQRPARNQRQPRSSETTKALEAKRELQRELHRMPEANRAANPKPAANVFPPPRAA